MGERATVVLAGVPQAEAPLALRPPLRPPAKPAAAPGNRWGASIGDAYGAGGLGPSGTGKGGAGSGHARVRSAHSVSHTNNQVAGVDEADIVKTDGKYVYLAMNGALRIVEALKPHVVSTTRLPGQAREMFVKGDRAVVYTSSAGARPRCTYGYDCQFAGDGSHTRILVFDISNRAAPKQVRRIDLSGSLMAARRIGNTVHTVVADNDAPMAPSYETWPGDVPMCGMLESAVRAKFARLKRENERNTPRRRPITWRSTICPIAVCSRSR